MNNKIYNTKVEVPKGVELNDKDYLDSLLCTLKDMLKNYTIAMTEASNEELYEEYYDTYVELSSLMRKVYEVMFREGWYQLEIAEENKIKTKYKELSNEMNDLEE